MPFSSCSVGWKPRVPECPRPHSGGGASLLLGSEEVSSSAPVFSGTAPGRLRGRLPGAGKAARLVFLRGLG